MCIMSSFVSNLHTVALMCGFTPPPSKKKIYDFLAVLSGFEKSMDIVEAFSSCVSGFK